MRACVDRLYPDLARNPDYTSIISPRHFTRLQGLVDDAAAQGARVVPLSDAGPDAAARRMTPTLLLDVPRVADPQRALSLMLESAAALAQALGGSVVDDNRKPLTDVSLQAIQHQLRSIQQKMETRGMTPGSGRALRLFS